MEAEIIEAKPPKSPSLSDVNAQLLRRLSSVIDGANSEDLLKITEAIAKLNASYKSNDQFGSPLSEEERREKEQQDILKDIMEAK